MLSKWHTSFIAVAGVTAGALVAVSGNELCAQAADPNAAPNPYKMQDNWAQLPGGPEIWRGHQGPGRSQRRQEHLGVRPLRIERMHEFDARTDGEVRFLRQVPEGLRRRHVRGSTRFLCGPRGQCVGGRPNRQERQGRRSYQVCSRRQGVDDFGQAGHARQRSAAI